MRSKQVDIYEVRELTVGQMLPIMPLATDDPSKFQQEMAKLSVHLNGESIGDTLNDLPFAFFMNALLPAVIEVNAMGESKNV